LTIGCKSKTKNNGWSTLIGKLII